MGEAQRQRYAQAMGLSLWYSRARLPGAPQSPARDFSGFVQCPAQEERRHVRPSRDSGERDHAQAAGRTSGSVVKAVELIQAVTAQRKAEPVPPQVAGGVELDQASRPEDAAVEQPRAMAEPVPECQVRAYRCEKYIFLNLAHPETDANREAMLLANLVSALWEGQEIEHLFDWVWPVFSNMRLPGQGGQAAARVLTEQLKGCSSETGGVVLLGCPPVWTDIPVGEPASFGSLMGGSDGAAHQVLLSTFSLGELLLEPQRKRDVWRHLRRLSDCR